MKSSALGMIKLVKLPMHSPDTHARLLEMLVRKSLRRGVFKLASGKESTCYIDGKLTTCSAAGTKLTGQAFLDVIERNGWRPRAVGGLIIGADPIVIAIARESLDRGNPIDAFLVRKEAKAHGMKKFVEGIEYEGSIDVVMVDDVCSTGGSTIDAIEKARQANMNVLGAVCLVDREMGAGEAMARVGCRFDSVFRISELLAYEEEHRNAVENGVAMAS
jgi:orotate phosphoribosyltransferase